MDRYDIGVVVKVDDEALRHHNKSVANGRGGVPIPPDIEDWDGRDLTYAIDREIAVLEDIDSISRWAMDED